MDAEQAYRRLAPAVLGYLRASGTPEPDDLLGDVFVQVARDLPRFRDAHDPEAVRSWVFTIARNRVVDDVRRRRRRPRLAGGGVPDREAPGRPDGPDADLVVALRSLSDDQREVVALRLVADLSLEEVGRLTGRSTGAVKALQHRALENLRRAVSPPGPPTL